MTSKNFPEDSPLGKPAAYQTSYEPALLFPIARIIKREQLGIGATLPFFGIDIWNAYEVSWLNLRGKPQIAIVTLTTGSTRICSSFSAAAMAASSCLGSSPPA